MARFVGEGLSMTFGGGNGKRWRAWPALLVWGLLSIVLFMMLVLLVGPRVSGLVALARVCLFACAWFAAASAIGACFAWR